MAAGLFVIEELRKTGQLTLVETDDGEPARFEWTADRAARTAAGGARACPVKPWVIGGQLVTKRTDYIGALVPSEQVLTAVQKNHTFNGEWNDKFNFGGYAVGEMARFEQMCRRGNPVRISFQNQVFEGLIIDWDFPYQGDWWVRYTFTFSVHVRVDDPTLILTRGVGVAGAAFALNRSPGTAPSPQESFDQVDLSVQAMMQTHQVAPRGGFVGDVADGVETIVGDLAAARDNASATLQQSAVTGAIRSGNRMVDDFRRLGTQLRSMRAQAFNLLGSLEGMRSDATIAVQQVTSVLDFEEWRRGMRYHAVVIMGGSNAAAKEIEARAKPPTIRTYKPQAGESIYSIALRFYGRASAWSYIAERNNLHTFAFDGTETLVIPERGEG